MPRQVTLGLALSVRPTTAGPDPDLGLPGWRLSLHAGPHLPARGGASQDLCWVGRAGAAGLRAAGLNLASRGAKTPHGKPTPQNTETTVIVCCHQVALPLNKCVGCRAELGSIPVKT